MARILITGAKGQLGSELLVVSGNYYGYDFLFTDIDSLDITNYDQTSEFIKNVKPDWIVNCAAYNLVDKAENEPEKALLLNGTAVSNITEIIHGSECRFIHVSSDYVYDGESNVPYTEDIPANPLSAYGRSKLAEEIMKIISGVIRNQIAMIPGIYNYSNEGACTWYDFAYEIIKEAGLSCNILPVRTKDYVQAAKRPAYSVMDKMKIKENYNLSIPHWRTSLIKCINLLK